MDDFRANRQYMPGNVYLTHKGIRHLNLKKVLLMKLRGVGCTFYAKYYV